MFFPSISIWEFFSTFFPLVFLETDLLRFVSDLGWSSLCNTNGPWGVSECKTCCLCKHISSLPTILTLHMEKYHRFSECIFMIEISPRYFSRPVSLCTFLSLSSCDDELLFGAVIVELETSPSVFFHGSLAFFEHTLV